ncbi:hypothetical protein [Gilvimarinus chinensis]|uniref:hypothetical protein n=1 Tax=Gilvimarinus chinensis TaxID=396005 RepID=UPI0003808F94|nr:hypothetical protein [Gilvimarinus chinensis]
MIGTSFFTLLAIAVGGFIFSTKCYATRYRIARQSGHKLYLPALGVGFVLAPLSLFSLESGYWICNQLENSACLPISADIKSLAFAIHMLFWGWLTAALYNKLPNVRTNALTRELQKNDFDATCLYASEAFKPIAITLETRKVYVGMIIDTPAPESEYLTFLPAYSGYRSDETLSFNLVNDYEHELKKLLEGDDDTSLQDLVIIVPKGKILSLHIYNDHLYQQLNS